MHCTIATAIAARATATSHRKNCLGRAEQEFVFTSATPRLPGRYAYWEDVASGKEGLGPRNCHWRKRLLAGMYLTLMHLHVRYL